jgi:NADPH-dependent ferric siderophore reductase
MEIPKPLHDQATDPRIERIRHEPKLRSLQVESIVRLTPGMLRLTFSGEDLSDFTSLGFDDHVKIFAPTSSGEVERRDYIPRRYDTHARTLVIDFAVHDAGPATRWTLDARPGDRLQVGGPKSSGVVTPKIQRWLLIGDETALPAIGRRIEEAKAGSQITSVIAMTGPQDHQSFETSAELTKLWAYRPLWNANDPSVLLSVLKDDRPAIGYLCGDRGRGCRRAIYPGLYCRRERPSAELDENGRLLGQGQGRCERENRLSRSHQSKL